MLASSKFPVIWAAEVNRTAWLPGRTCGQRWVLSPAFILVRGAGVPPLDDTRERPPLEVSASTMLPSSPQLAPRILDASHKVIAAPPSTEIFLSLLSAVN